MQLMQLEVEYLEKQEQVEKLHSAGFNPLHFAAFYGRVRSIQHLLKTNNALVNEKTNGGFTALHIAAMRGNDDAVRQLLNNEAAIDARDNEGRTALHHAGHHLGIIDLLVDHGANIDATDTHGQTPLLIAVMRQSLTTVTHLLARSANVYIAPSSRSTAIHYAAAFGNNQIIEALLKHGAYFFDFDSNEPTPLHYIAAFSNNPEGIKLLLKYGARAHLQDKLGKNSLHNAARAGHFEPIALLISKVGDINAFDSQRLTALDHAVLGCNCDPAAIRLFIRSGATMFSSIDRFKNLPGNLKGIVKRYFNERRTYLTGTLPPDVKPVQRSPHEIPVYVPYTFENMISVAAYFLDIPVLDAFKQNDKLHNLLDSWRDDKGRNLLEVARAMNDRTGIEWLISNELCTSKDHADS